MARNNIILYRKEVEYYMSIEALELGLGSGQVLSGQEIAERGLTHLWGEGGLIMVIKKSAPEWQRVSFRVMTKEEYSEYVRKNRNSGVADMPGP